MSLRRSHHGWRIAIVSLVLVALISLPIQAVSQDSGWQFSLVAEHEGGFIRGGLGPDMIALVQDAWGKGELSLYRITIEGGRTRGTQTRRGPDDGTIRIVDLLAGKVLATASSEPSVFGSQFLPGTAEVLFYEAHDDDRLTTWRYLEGEPTDCVEVDPGIYLLLVDSGTALVFRSGEERPIGRVDLGACALEWGAPMRPINILWSPLLLPDRSRFAYVDLTGDLGPKVVIRSVDAGRPGIEPPRQAVLPDVQVFAEPNLLGFGGEPFQRRMVDHVIECQIAVVVSLGVFYSFR